MAAVEVGVKGEVLCAGVEQGAAFETAVDRRGGAHDLGLPAAHRRGEGNAVVGGLDDPAHRLRAVAQRFRTAEDLDLLDRERIDGHAVILTQIGDVHGADAVLLHPDAEIVQPAQDRARCAGRKTGRRGARQSEEQVAEALGRARLNLTAGDRRQRGRRLVERRRCRRLTRGGRAWCRCWSWCRSWRRGCCDPGRRRRPCRTRSWARGRRDRDGGDGDSRRRLRGSLRRLWSGLRRLRSGSFRRRRGGRWRRLGWSWRRLRRGRASETKRHERRTAQKKQTPGRDRHDTPQ